ncbi:hypothetical protein INR49_012543 [Caranx melampygus]|nr:hypothetical protein INR49_012543 [Caranx melampygus]
MQYLGGKLSAAQLQVAGWVGSVRRSLQDALELVWGPAEEKQEEGVENNEEEEEEVVEGGGGRFQRAMTPLRSFARRSRRSLRRFSSRSRQTLQRRATESRSAQVKSYFGSEEDKDTDALTDREPEQQNGSCEQTPDTDSPKHIPDQVPEVSSQDDENTDSNREAELAPFPESSTPLLDTSAQRSKADVGKRRLRTRPSRLVCAGSTRDSADWRACDSTDGKEASATQRESDSDEEQPKTKMACSPPTSQRVPIFPGLSPAHLLAQLKKRTGGAGGGGGADGGEETEADKGREERPSQQEETAPSPSQPTPSPRLPAHLAGAARVLPPIGGGDQGACAHYRIMVRMAAWAELGSVCQCARDRGASLLRSSVMDTMGATDLLHQQAFCCCGQK